MSDGGTSRDTVGASARVWATVVTFNRKALLRECLEALAAQSHRLEGVVVVDNASTDGTADELREWPVLDRLNVLLLQLPRNGGGAEGFHAGIAEASRQEADWIWAMDDDCVPSADALETLLASQAAKASSTVAVVPVVRSIHGGVQSIHSGGQIKVRLVGGAVAPLPERCYESGEHPIEYFSFVGPLMRADAVRATALPPREFFIWGDDVDFSTSLGHHGSMWVVTSAHVIHKDGQPANRRTYRELARNYTQSLPFNGLWKYAYGLRNLIDWGRRGGYIRPWHVVSWVSLYLLRSLLFERDKLLRCRIFLMFAADGWRGRPRTVSPAVWPKLAQQRSVSRFLDQHAMTYGELPSPRPLSRQPSDTATPTVSSTQ